MKYKDWLDEWFTYYVIPNTKARTCEKYRTQIEKHIKPRLGYYSVGKLSAQILQQFTSELTESGFSANTVNGIISVLKSSLKRAVVLGVAAAQCSDAIVRPRVREKQIESFTQNEQRAIERYIADSKKNKLFGIVLCMYTGLRIGELLALTWKDLDFSKGIITVNKTCRDGWENGVYVKKIDSPKTENGYRVVPVPRQMLAKLKEIKKSGSGEYVVNGKSKYGAEVRSYQKTFERLLAKLNIPHRGFHALRHTFATRAIECGMDVRTLADLMGHSNPMITLKRYTHSMMEHKIEMMNRLGKYMR